MSFIESFFKRPNRPPKPKPKPEILDPIILDPITGTMEVRKITQDHHSVAPIGMSYWRNINQHNGSEVLEVCLSIGGQLTKFMLDKRTLDVLTEIPLGIQHTGEGINYSRKYSDMLFYGMGKEYYRLNTITRAKTVVWLSRHNLWQCHMDYNESIYSATLKNDNWEIIGYGVNEWTTPLKFNPDECQIDKSGDWLCIKETRPEDDKLVNRFIRVATGAERIIQAEEGALGHSDVGFNCMLGENSFSNVGGAVDFFDLNTAERRLIYSTGTWNLGYVSLTNIHPNLPLEAQKGLISSADGRLISIALDGSGRALQIADLPVYIPGITIYEVRPKANLCPNGEFAIWTDDRTGKLEAYIVRVPVW